MLLANSARMYAQSTQIRTVCMYVCMCVRMYVCTYVRMYVHTYCTKQHLGTVMLSEYRAQGHVRMYVCMYVCVYVCTYVYITVNVYES